MPSLDFLHLPPDFPADMRRALAGKARVARLETGDAFLQRGQEVDVFALVSDGLLRVRKLGPDGREITLYTVGRGECCLLNVLCLMNDVRAPADAVAEEPVTALLYRRSTFLSWMENVSAFRSFIFHQLGDRVLGMMELVEEVAFHSMDRRLARYLAEKADDRGTVAVTHEQIAHDLGTVREVVSRLLKCFERRGVVELGRRRIVVRDAARLRDLHL